MKRNHDPPSPREVTAFRFGLWRRTTVYVAALRKKLDRGFPRELFHTIKGAGYRFGVVD